MIWEKQYPRLAAMRARRQQIEAEIAAPYKAAAEQALAIARAETSARRAIERLIEQPIIKHLIGKIGHEMERHVHHEIMKAAVRATKVQSMTVLELPTDMLLAADTTSVVSRVVDWWRANTAPRLRLYGDRSGQEPVQQDVAVIDIRLPEMAYREYVSNLE